MKITELCKILGIVFIFIPALLTAATLTGKVTDALTGIALPGANVVVEGTERGAASDSEGNFLIKSLPAGRYTIKTSFIGYETSSRKLTLADEETRALDFKLRESFFQTQQVVITATREERILENTPVVMEIIGKTEIEERGAENLAQALEDRPGIIIQENAAGGKSLNLNGIDGRRVLILVDGLPLSGKLNNQVDLTLLDSDRIEHIEIVKGPASALYGSEAMGGVVNIITNKATDKNTIRIKQKYGTNDLTSGNLYMSGRQLGIGYQLNVDRTRGGVDKNEALIEISDLWSDGVDGKINFQAPVFGTITAGAEYKKDGHDYQETSTGHGGSVTVYNDEARVERLNSVIGINRTLKKADIDIQVYHHDYERELTTIKQGSTTPPTVAVNDELLYGLKSDFRYHLSDKLELDMGYDYSNDTYKSDRLLYDSVERELHGLFGQVEYKPVSRVTLLAGGRYDKISHFDGSTSPRISAMVELAQDLRLRASWGGGFRAPSFTDMYIDYSNPYVVVKGNPDLKPEKSSGGNAGLEHIWNGNVMTSVSYFHNRFTDLIMDYIVPGTGVSSYLNIDDAKFTGIEFQNRIFVLNNLTTTLGYNYTHIEQSDEDFSISRISPHTASLRIVYKLFRNRVSLSFREQYSGKRDIKAFDPQAHKYNIEQKNAYSLMDASCLIKVNNYLSLQGGVTNALDYRDKDYGPWVGRRYFITLNTDF